MPNVTSTKINGVCDFTAHRPIQCEEVLSLGGQTPHQGRRNSFGMTLVSDERRLLESARFYYVKVADVLEWIQGGWADFDEDDDAVTLL